jgi:hypothetical protein
MCYSNIDEGGKEEEDSISVRNLQRHCSAGKGSF